ncbi:portal protein, partial [Candidatus Woesearchaeota archaeon]|nr:portal protein [Candidatus Woesearchaeota archaeon]
MSGFTLRNIDGKPSGFIARIQRNIRYFSALGMQHDDKTIKQSKAIGITEATEDTMYNMYGQSQIFTGSDIGGKEFIAFYDKEYPTRRDFLRRFAMNGEIEHVLEVIADETIIYDDNNYFAYPNTKVLKSVLKQEKAKEIIDDLNAAYKKVYYAFGFNDGHDAWHYCKKLLVDGFLAFEIIYDVNKKDDAENVIGFKELDPVSLEPELKKDELGNEYKVWIQYKGDAERQRELLDSNLIYISWARTNFVSRLSYVERLVRSFNMLRTLENSRIIWNVINSQYRMKIVVPIGTQSEAKARTRLAELRGMYKEDITIADESGEVTINGQPNFSFAKTYILPSKEGNTTEIDSFKPEGYNMQDTDSLKYFWMRFIVETKVPESRFSTSAESEGVDGGSWTGGDEIAREEIRFSNFINRIRSIFKDILLKPTWYQFCLKHPEFADDMNLKGAIGLLFVEENLFTVAKQRSVANAGASIVSTLMGITQPGVGPDGSPTDVPYFDPKFLIEKYMQMTDVDLALNKKYRDERQEEIRKLTAAYARLNAARGEGEQGEGSMGGDEGFGGGFGGDFGGEGGMDFGGD